MKNLFPRLISSFECPDEITDSSDAAINFLGKVKTEKTKTRKTKNKKVFKPVFQRKYSLILFSLEINNQGLFIKTFF
jgi:hypothetical protein